MIFFVLLQNVVERELRTGGQAHRIVIKLSVAPLDRAVAADSSDTLIELPSQCPASAADAVRSGVRAALAQGCVAGFPLTNAHVTVEQIELLGESETSSHVIGGAASASARRGSSASPSGKKVQVPSAMLSPIEQCATFAVLETAKSTQLRMWEPVMTVEGGGGGVQCSFRFLFLGIVELADEQFFGAVLSDLVSQRRGIVEHVVNGRKVTAHAPLAELMDFSDLLRSLSKGELWFFLFSRWS